MSNSSCQLSTGGSNQPFNIPVGKVIFNRSDGSIEPNITHSGSITSTIFTSVTSTTITSLASTSSYSAAPRKRNDELAIGAGVGLPLGLALIVVSGLLFLEIRRKRGKQQEAMLWKGRFLLMVRQKKREGAVDKEDKIGKPLTELSGWRIDELHGDSPVSNEFGDTG